MAMELGNPALQLRECDLSPACAEARAPVEPHAQPASNLAALLDRFTAGINNPDAETVGSFAATVEALHGELVMLARHFGAGADSEADTEHIDLDDIFPDTPSHSITFEPHEPGIAADEELEHVCRQLSRG